MNNPFFQGHWDKEKKRGEDPAVTEEREKDP